MRPILIIEDNEQKYLAIESSLKQALDVDVYRARTVRSAYNLIENNSWAALVLDMTFEDAEGLLRTTSKKPLAGIEVLQFIAGSNLKLPTLVVTQHDQFAVKGHGASLTLEELRELLSEAFPVQCLGVVRSRLGESDSDWLEQITLTLKGALVEENQNIVR